MSFILVAIICLEGLFLLLAAWHVRVLGAALDRHKHRKERVERYLRGCPPSGITRRITSLLRGYD